MAGDSSPPQWRSRPHLPAPLRNFTSIHPKPAELLGSPFPARLLSSSPVSPSRPAAVGPSWRAGRMLGVGEVVRTRPGPRGCARRAAGPPPARPRGGWTRSRPRAPCPAVAPLPHGCTRAGRFAPHVVGRRRGLVGVWGPVGLSTVLWGWAWGWDSQHGLVGLGMVLGRLRDKSSQLHLKADLLCQPPGGGSISPGRPYRDPRASRHLFSPSLGTPPHPDPTPGAASAVPPPVTAGLGAPVGHAGCPQPDSGGLRLARGQDLSLSGQAARVLRGFWLSSVGRRRTRLRGLIPVQHPLPEPPRGANPTASGSPRSSGDSGRETKMKTWVCDSGQKLEIFIPFLGKYRPFSGRCCQTCTPKSWDGFYHKQLSSLGFCDASRVTEEDTRCKTGRKTSNSCKQVVRGRLSTLENPLTTGTSLSVSLLRYRGWLVRRVCGFLAVWDWKVLADTPGDLPARICRSKRVRNVATGRSSGSRGDGECHRRWKEKALKILAEIQAPLSLLMLRVCNWALLKLLNHLFLSVQLHRGQLEMVLRAARTPGVPLVFLSTHKSQLDGLLLSFLLFSQGLGVPRVTVGGQVCSPRLRALLGRLGGIFLPSGTEQTPSDRDEGLPGAVLATYVEEVLRSRQPLLIFLEEPPVALRLSAPAREWLALVYRAVRDGAVPDVLLVPVGIAYDVVPGGLHREGHDARPLGLGACLWAACRAVRRNFGCARVDFAQPFSLQVRQPGFQLGLLAGSFPALEGLWPRCRWLRKPLRVGPRGLGWLEGIRGSPGDPEFAAKNLVRQSCEGKLLEELLLPAILGTCPSQLDGKKAEAGGPGPTTGASSEAEEEMLVTKLGLHSLSDGVACSAVMAVGITSALLLHKHREVRQGGVQVSVPLEQDFRSCPHHVGCRLIFLFLQGVFLSRLMLDFAWLLEEILLRQRDVGFSGQLRALVQHSLVLLGARLTLYRLSPIGDVLVVPEASAEALRELGHHSAAILPVFASEAVGACAIRALLMEMLPFLGVTVSPSGIVLSQDELHRKCLELLRLLPPNLLGLQPCQPLECRSQDVVDKLLLCGLLEAEEPESERWVCDLAPRPFCRGQPWAGMDFTDSDSDSEDEVPKRCFKLREPQGSPGFLLFLCRLLSPVLRTYARAVAFLDRPSWPQPEAAYVEALLRFLAEEDAYPNRSLALSSLQTFKEMGVLEEVQTPAGPLLQLAQPFRSSASRGKLEAFIRQFAQP
ncbi:glycerol-3-phosphate acyltransferase 2, mitochondrial-like [Mycteria americana]|uniref:glycerol-3-phosphate acyltransferase 2, mitochondrial-like n=1 Tax=Mycteria americana TaxID=33587 RepID=UPI003F582F69